MQEFLNQAYHNKELLEHLCSTKPDHYYDWKITLSFYVALHYLKQLADTKNVKIGHTHAEISNNVSTNSRTRILIISNTAWSNYHNLYTYSRTARYSGFINFEDFNTIQKNNYIHSAQLLRNFELYIISQIENYNSNNDIKKRVKS
jgi:hypothetical protein